LHDQSVPRTSAGSIAALAGSGALAGNAAQYGRPGGADLVSRTAAPESWCATRAANGVWQHGRDVDGALGQLRQQGRPDPGGLDFASQDYLSLSSHPAVRAAGLRALDEAGPHNAGSATRPGNTGYGLQLEQALGALLGLEHVALFPTDWDAAFGAITALVHGRDHVVIDQLAHTALRQGALAATPNVHVHRHLDPYHVRELLAAIRARDDENGILLVTEAVFGIDSDSPDLPLLQHLCRQYGATLLVDVAHDLGACGPGGSGVIGEQRMPGKIDLVTGSFSNTFAACGGFAASAIRGVKRQLQLSIAPQFSNALAPLQAAIALECLRIVTSDEGAALRAQLLSNARELRGMLADAGLPCPGSPSPVVTVPVGSEAVARLAAKLLARGGLFANQLEYPRAPAGAAHLCLQLTASHSLHQVRHGARLVGACVGLARQALAAGNAPPSESVITR
jgi:7-keto-8-aminopelargonate synthetase-like enzyme